MQIVWTDPFTNKRQPAEDNMTNDEIAGLEKARTIADTEALEQLAKRVGDTVSPYEAQLLLTILSRPDYFRLPDPALDGVLQTQVGRQDQRMH